MACIEEQSAYPGKRLGMEDTTLTLEQVEHMLPAPRTISSVRIREFDDTTANPEPIVQDEEEADQLLEEFLSPSKLRSLTGFSNLDQVEYLEMRVDTRENSLGNFGALLPNLTELKLSYSLIATVRDLGTSLTNLRTLWLARSGLSDLDGISSVSSLKELYLAFNHIEDVSPVSMLDQLEILDLEGNNVSDLARWRTLSKGKKERQDLNVFNKLHVILATFFTIKMVKMVKCRSWAEMARAGRRSQCSS